LVGADSHDYDGVLAQHWEAAGDAEVAIGYYERAARHAAERFANAEATAYYERALALLPATNKAHRFDLLEAQQHLLESLGHTEQRQVVLDELLALAETWQDGARLARVRAYRYSSAIYMGAGLSLPQGEDDEIISVLQQAGEQELLLDLLELVATRSWWGYAFPFDRAKGLARQQQALATAEQMRDEYRTFINRALLAEMRDELPEAEVALQRALQFANQQGDLRKQWMVYHRLGRLAAGNNPHSAIPHHQQAMRRGRDMADTRLELISADNLGLMASSVGAYELAYDTWQRALELLTLRGHSAIEHAFGMNKVVFALLRSGRIADGCDLAEQAGRLALDSNDDMILLQTRLLQAEGATLLGNVEQAGAIYRTIASLDAPDLAALAHLQGFEVYFASDVGAWYARQGDWRRAERFLTVAVEGFSTLAPHPMRDDDEVALLSLARLLEVYHAQGNHRAMRTMLAQAERALVAYRGREWSLVSLHAAQAQGHLMLGDAATAATWHRRARLLVERHATTFRQPDWQAQFLALHAPILAHA
jgi:tetratricopeptide (TPR) repeat protein